uniref:ATP synthase complex subunit 8 n=1 Tax=Pycanum ochraceum TaxID=299295 RepID=A0A8E7EQY0_9HEMI|nr:ATP synthase F0 subunit 8 [Pycanum ochraceum]
MPQMAPMSWETLYFMFITLFFITSIIIYHSPKLPEMSKGCQMKSIIHLNWKW